ncbi:MAG: hypothetical protein OXN16_09820 [Gammaproteobacteria bacterium]|nr:hypothetical protein [Gammaproteobacteria bacterium]
MASSTEQAAIRHLHDARAYFVLCDGKSPVWRGWNRRRPGVDTCVEHHAHGQLGVVPWSLKETVWDVDGGDPEELRRRLGPPRVVLDSQSRTGTHQWYDDILPRKNSQFQVGDCHGDIRGASGFVVIAGQQFTTLLEGMRRTGRFTFQSDLLDAARELERSAPDGPIERRRGALVNPVPLDQAVPGNRNVSLFEAARHHIYPLQVPTDFDEWLTTCRNVVYRLALRIEEHAGFQDDEADIAYSIATWCWNRGGHIQRDHTFNAQFRRGVKRYHGNARPATVRAILSRNGRVCDLYDIGWTQADIAADAGLSQRAVSGIIRKAGHYGFEIERQTITRAAPWVAEGISRATWYRRK